MDLKSFILCQEYILTLRQFSYQSIEHSNADTSQQAQLSSANLLAASPIVEEEADVESSPFPLNHEVLPPDQHPTSHAEDLEKDQSKKGDGQISAGNLIPDASSDQHIVIVTKHNVVPCSTFDLGDTSSKDDVPMANVQPTNMAITQEELDQLEKDNPLEAFDFPIKSDVLFSRSTGKSPDVSASGPSETSKDNLLAEFRNKVSGVNLFEAIEQNDTIIFEVKELLHKLGELPFGSKFREFSQALEPLMDGINQGFQQKKVDQSKLEEQTLHYNQLLAEVATFQGCLPSRDSKSSAKGGRTRFYYCQIQGRNPELGASESQHSGKRRSHEERG